MLRFILIVQFNQFYKFYCIFQVGEDDVRLDVAYTTSGSVNLNPDGLDVDAAKTDIQTVLADKYDVEPKFIAVTIDSKTGKADYVTQSILQ